MGGERKGREGGEGRGETVKCAVEIFIYFRLCIVLPSGAVLMRPNDFKLKAISGSNCRTIQTKFNVEKELSPRKYLNVLLQIFMLCNLKCYSFLSVNIK
jgi:hypothetical protein